MGKRQSGSAVRRFAAEYLRTMDPDQAAAEAGVADGVRLLASPRVAQEIAAQRTVLNQSICTEDIVRRLAGLAFGRANDCVRLVLEAEPEVETLDLSLLSEIKRSDKGAVEIKLLDRLQVLEQLAQMTGSTQTEAASFFRALESTCEKGDAE